MINKIDIDLNAISHNLRTIKKLIYPETKIIGVVKANAYGHGLIETARAIWTSGADILAVQTIDEAVDLRVNKIRSPIIVLGYVEPKEFYKALDFDITLTAHDFDLVYLLHLEAKKQNRWAKVDVKVDTGLNRLGFKAYEAAEMYQKIMALEHVKIEGIHSHFVATDDKEYSELQIKEFKNVLFNLQQQGIQPPMVHMASSDAVFLYNESQFDAVRVGLALYGHSGVPEFDDMLQPALSLKSQIVSMRRIGKNESVSYGRDFVAKDPKKIAVVPIGYFDGYPRSLSGKVEALVCGSRVKIAGRVCMNATMFDVTGINCGINDEVILIGDQKNDKVTAEEIAKLSGSYIREILCRLPAHIPREYHFK